MQPLPVEIYGVDAVRAIDRAAIDGEGIPGYTLMTRAGIAALREAHAAYGDASRWQVVCGAGNNGGDGYVVARLAADEGIAVSVVAMSDPDTLGGDAKTAYGDYVANGGVVRPWDGALDPDADLLIDALLGSGLERPVEGRYAEAVVAMNAHRAPVLAIDMPSGVHGDSGAVLGCAVRADLTVTFVGLKAGLFLGDGPGHAGVIRFDALEIPTSCRAAVEPVLHRIGDALLDRCLPPRPRAAHKGDFGHVLLVGGGAGMPGAIRLAGEAALRSGAGLVTLATSAEHAAVIVATRPELMAHGVDRGEDLESLLQNADVIAFGPGLGSDDWAQSLYVAVARSDKPAVWDADALNLLAQHGGRLDTRIVTPHPGEAGRLLGCATRDIQADRPAALAQLVGRYGGVAVLKGSGTLVSRADAAPWLSSAGNPGMAAPGMGDALTGVIAALLAQGLSLEDAAAIGVELHARAGDRAASRGERGLMASDLIAELRGVANR